MELQALFGILFIMIPEVQEYLKDQRVGVLAVEMLDGSPHAATVHFALSGGTFVFLTDSKYRKAQPFMDGSNVRSSFVVGTEEAPEGEKEKTLQIDGVARLAGNDDATHREAYLTKFPSKAKYDGPDDIFLVLTPTWWRFTDWSAPGGKTVWLSDGSIQKP